MARDHARIYLTVWDDEDWTSLTSVQQLVYIALTSSTDLSYCGVAPLVPARYQHISADMSPRRFMSAVDGLEVARFVVADRATAEVLVRSYVRWDGILKQPNVTKALVKALHKVHSTRIRRAVTDELTRLYVERPGEKGWRGFQELDPEGFENLCAKALRKGSPKGSANPKATPLPPSPFPLPQSSSSSSPTAPARLSTADRASAPDVPGETPTRMMPGGAR